MSVEEDDKKLLDKLCSRVSDGNISDDENDDGALNTTSVLADEGSDKRPELFIDKAKDVLPVMNDPGKLKKMDYPTLSFLGSAAVTMATAMKRHYREGSQELAEKGHLPAATLSRIDSNIPAIGNFVRLNRITDNRRKIAPMSSIEDGYICLLELDLIAIFWKDKDLRELLQSLALPEFPSTPHPAQTDITLWLSDKEPGYLITTILTDIGNYSEELRKKQRGY
ncbi:hypothetical protein BGZ51_006804 [Haplosporangium sp. Z 767]|nr:hypothetical protein BGZ51_006804 [Haplosporangium sp. Z 767]